MKKGNFRFELPYQPIEDERRLWHQVDLKISDGQKHKAMQSGWVQMPIAATSYGVISDIDDTILQTGASNILESIKTTFTKNAATRLSFPGVDQLYTALQRSKSSYPANPIFYLSNSPWNLYDFLDEFMELKKIPRGSVLLRDYGIDHEKLIIDNNHKLLSIAKILDTYPDLKFILIGDSGEKDPEYYHQIVEQYPGRILAIYIRDASKESRDSEVLEIADQVNAMGVPMFLMEDSYVAAEHAYTMGWITKEAMELVREAVWE